MVSQGYDPGVALLKIVSIRTPVRNSMVDERRWPTGCVKSSTLGALMEGLLDWLSLHARISH